MKKLPSQTRIKLNKCFVFLGMFQLSPTHASTEHRQEQGSTHLCAARAHPGISLSLPGAGRMGIDVGGGTCGWPEPLLGDSVICLLTFLAIPCRPLLCALFVLLIVNLLPNYTWTSAFVQTAQTPRHTGTLCCKQEWGQGWGILWTWRGHGFLHPVAGPMHHVGSTNALSPLFPYSKSAPASLGPRTPPRS